jgi:hypothetical protein
MKKNIKKHAFYTALLVVISFAFQVKLQAQNQLICPEPKTNKAQLQRMLQYRKNGANNLQAQTAGVQIRVFAHIVAQNDGSQAGAIPDSILSEIKTMNNDFASSGICFVYVGYNEIRNSTLNHIIVDEDHPDNEALFEPYVISSCLNIFYVDSIRGTNSASGGRIGGITFDLPSNFCLVGKKSLGKHTSSHETGHCFGLFHTFDSQVFGLENIDGSNCNYAGDIICDTKADPYAFKGAFCYSESGGFYTGFCNDPNGDNNWDPPYTNIMSYWHHDPETFTTGQSIAMLLTIGNESILSNLKSVDYTNFYPATYTYQTTFVSAISSITTVGNIQLLQLSKTGLFAQKVIINPGFHAMPGAGGYVKIQAHECNGSGTNLSINNTDVSAVATKQTQTITNSLLVYPNPSTGIFTVKYNNKGKFAASITIRNIMGQIVYRTSSKDYFNSLQENINITGKTKGIYMVEILSGDKKITSKILIQ